MQDFDTKVQKVSDSKFKEFLEFFFSKMSDKSSFYANLFRFKFTSMNSSNLWYFFSHVISIETSLDNFSSVFYSRVTCPKETWYEKPPLQRYLNSIPKSYVVILVEFLLKNPSMIAKRFFPLQTEFHCPLSLKNL